MKKKLGKFIEGILLASSTVTTATVLLIVFFLFSEGISVFKKSPLEGENIVAIHPAAGIEAISATEIKDIFDREINTWSELGGANVSIVLFTFNDLPDYFTEEQTGSDFENLPVLLDSLISNTPGMIGVYSSEYVMKEHKSKIINVRNVGLAQFLLGKEWFPTAQPAAQLGVLPLILGTLWVSLFAILFALPVGLATAIYMAEVADSRMRNILKPVIELLAGIPSVVYGFFGLIVIVPAIQNLFNLPVGETALAGSIVLAIMALPTIITVSEDALRNTPRSVKEASLALGANRWQTILRVSLPYSVSGISAAAILGIGRAMGETMAVLMVTGNAAVIPHSLLHPVRTIPATIAAELGEASQGGLHYDALFALGCILFLITMVINIWVESISRKRRRSLA